MLSGSDVEKLLAAITSLKHRAILMTAYRAGLRIGEVLARGQTETLPSLLFLSRFLQHVLPHGFVKIGHYGLFASGNVTTRLERARVLLGGDDSHRDAPPTDQKGETASTSDRASICAEVCWREQLRGNAPYFRPNHFQDPHSLATCAAARRSLSKQDQPQARTRCTQTGRCRTAVYKNSQRNRQLRPF